VESAKLEARRLTEAFESTGTLGLGEPFFSEAAIDIYGSDEYTARLAGDSIGSILKSHLANISEGDYFALLAYLDRSIGNIETLQSIRYAALSARGCATTLGFGPRFLHSAGQAHKGGPDSGVFLQITADDEVDLEIPDRAYSFAVAKDAQAFGDFEVLTRLGRRALHIRIKGAVKEGLHRILASMK
jgi:transaldolase/glucose-6-phosphate isomerase